MMNIYNIDEVGTDQGPRAVFFIYYSVKDGGFFSLVLLGCIYVWNFSDFVIICLTCDFLIFINKRASKVSLSLSLSLCLSLSHTSMGKNVLCEYNYYDCQEWYLLCFEVSSTFQQVFINQLVFVCLQWALCAGFLLPLFIILTT